SRTDSSGNASWAEAATVPRLSTSACRLASSSADRSRSLDLPCPCRLIASTMCSGVEYDGLSFIAAVMAAMRSSCRCGLPLAASCGSAAARPFRRGLAIGVVGVYVDDDAYPVILEHPIRLCLVRHADEL